MPLVESAMTSPEYATTAEHLATHFPKNAHCQWCNRANLQAASARRVKPDVEKIPFGESKPMSHVYGDRMIMGQRSEGNQNQRSCLLLIDSHTGFERAYPMPTRDQKFTRDALQHFRCSRHPGTKALFRSACARELTGSARDLGFIADPLLPQRKVHNARCENRINIVKRGARALLLRSGLPHAMWPECVQRITDSRSFVLPSITDESVSRYEAVTGEPYKGKIIPFGALVYHRPYDANKSQKAIESWSKPGLVAGYSLRPGLRWSTAYRVID